MPVGLPYTPRVAVAPELPGTRANENRELVTRCGRCRLNFVRHPSITPSHSSKWWLCPPCRTRLLGDESRTNSRWGRSDEQPRNLDNRGDVEHPQVEEISSTVNRNEEG